MTEQSDIVGRLRDAACQGACRWEIMGDPPRRVDVPIGDVLQDAATEIERLRDEEAGWRVERRGWLANLGEELAARERERAAGYRAGYLAGTGEAAP